MVPRSYSLLQQHTTTAARDRRHSTSTEKMGARSQRTSPVSSITRTLPMHSKDTSPRPPVPSFTPPPTMQTSTHAHSKPVVIPPRSPARIPVSTQTVRVRGHHGGRRGRVPDNHRPDAIPAAVAALLAVTEIPPPPPGRRRKGSRMSRRISMDELIQEWRQADADPGTSLTGSPLDVLLGRVDEEEDDYGSFRSDQERDSLTSRSISSESITSTIPPSLDPDAPSIASTWDSPSTPSFGRRSSSERREKIVQSPPKEDCILDHPLLHFVPEDCEEIARVAVQEDVPATSTSTARFKSFKSNLTASLQALKSAAKSFSNFTAPSVPPDDLLTRSLLSPEFASEMRPKQMQGFPSPALRRYLNPQPTPISPADMHLHGAQYLDSPSDSSAPMIQMQTYDRRSRSSSRKRRSSSDPSSEAGRALSSSPAVRQREPRENCDFLRVIVLEMNMRRNGKLDTKAVGKARIWLPPRKPCAIQPAPADGTVPNRWIAKLAEEQ